MRTSAAGPLAAAALCALCCNGPDGENAIAPQPTPVVELLDEEPKPAREERSVVESVRLEPSSPTPGQPVRAIVTTRDRGAAATLHYRWSVNDRPFAQGGDLLALPFTRKGDEIEVRVTAGTGDAAGEPAIASARVRNRAPRLRGVQLEPPIGEEREIWARATAEDPDGDRIEYRYRWTLNAKPVAADGAVLRRSLQRGDAVRVSVVATDGEDESEPQASATLRIENAAPAIVSRPAGTEVEGLYHYAVRAEDPDGDRTLRFSLSRSPEGMTIDWISGLIEWAPRADQVGSHPVVVVVEDADGARDSQRFEVRVGKLEPGEPTPPASPRTR